MAAASGSERERLLNRLGALQTEFEHQGGYELEARARASLCGLGFQADELDAPFSRLSGGWRMRAELGRILVARPDLLLLDEPSNYLDLPAVEWLQRFLREFKGTLMLISHDRYLLESLTDVTVEIAGGDLTRYAGGFAYYLEQREQRYLQQLAAKKNQDRRREQVERFVERFRSKNTKASQVQSRIKMLDKMEDVHVRAPVAQVSSLRLAEPPHCGAEIIRMEGAGYTYDGERWILRGVDLAVQRGDKTALVGFNGMGKTTLLRLLAGQLETREGRRALGHQVVIGYQSQEFAETLPPARNLHDILRDANPDADTKGIRSILGGFGFSGDDVSKPCEVLSGGEKIRLAFARIFINPPNFLILDEPTTHLDLAGRQALEQALETYRGTVCFVSHDVHFVRHVATSILAMTPPGVTRYHGGYDYYLEKAGSVGAGAPAPASASGKTDGPKGVDRKMLKRQRAEARQAMSKQRRALEKTMADAETAIERLEGEQAELLEVLSAQEAGVDFAETNRRLQAIQEELGGHNQAWETAAVAHEELTS